MHSPNRENTGENIAMKFSSDGALMSGILSTMKNQTGFIRIKVPLESVLCLGVEATNEWYSEIKDYTFAGEANMACGHFSQVVWVGSQTAGFGRAQAADGSVFVVGQYSPAGNYVGQWQENVLPPVDGRTDLLDATAAGVPSYVLCMYTTDCTHCNLIP